MPDQVTAGRYARWTEPENLDLLRHLFRSMNRAMVYMWRLGLGRFMDIWPNGFGRLLVIEHTGRRSGAAYRTPVNYTVDDGEVYCVAAFGERTDWYRNIMAEPDVAVWLPDGRWSARAEEASGHPRRDALMRGVLMDSGFAAPLFGLDPRRLGDAELARATSEYCLVRLQPTTRSPSRQGPGDLTWVWAPIVASVGLAWLARLGRHRH